ncbi:MAG: M28 family peptidase [Gemmatimonadales bacterium]|nr:M28 family peptidase [Gemmatimonadales bacterium]MDQ3426808.1 M28 family peptidase [Gemmatimonadota bacterium]
MRLARVLPALLLLGACREAPRPREFDGPGAFRYIETQVAFGARIPGTEAHAGMAQWLDSLLRERADTLVVQSWNHVTAKGDTLPLKNFLARFRPAAQQRLLLFAHWDSRPTADGPTSSDSTVPVPGANDGGSGVALLLGVADVLKRSPPGIGVDLLFVDGEDYGDFNATPPADVLIGSRYYAANQPPGPQPLYAVLFDLVADKELQIYQEGNSLIGAPEVVELVWDTARELGYGGSFVASPRHTLIDDHLELQKVGIRAIDVVDFDYPAWHTAEDTLDKVSAESLQTVGDVAVALIRREE